MYRHLVIEMYHTVMYTLLPIDYVVLHSQSATTTDFVYIENRQILYTILYTSRILLLVLSPEPQNLVTSLLFLDLFTGSE